MKENGQRVVGSFVKNTYEEVRAYLNTFEGYQLAQIRIFTENGNGTDVPTKKGIAIRVEQLPKLKELVDALLAAAEEESSAREGGH